MRRRLGYRRDHAVLDERSVQLGRRGEPAGEESVLVRVLTRDDLRVVLRLGHAEPALARYAVGSS